MVFLWLIGVSVVIALCLVLVRHSFSYWKRKGIPSVHAIPPFGCLGPVVRKEKSLAVVLRDIHLNSNEPILGIYCLYRSVLLVRDPELVKRILITDFEYFTHRGYPYDEKNDPFAAHLIAMTYTRWKQIRAKFSPSFSSGKLKNMFPAVVAKTFYLKKYLDKLTETSTEVRMKELFEHAMVSTLASIFFGFELNAFENPDHKFVQMGKVFFDAEKLRNQVINVAVFCFPQLFSKLKMNFYPRDVTKYALQLVKSVMELRKSDPSLCRNDVIQTIFDLMEDPEKRQEIGKDNEKLTLEMCTAQALIFYAAGYETTASAASFCLYELAKCPEWMEKVQIEVDVLMAKRNGKIIFEDLVELKNLDLCIKETLRMYPAVPVLNRECTKDYRVPGTNHVIEKGTPIVISHYGLQMDEEFFKNPKVFDPSRFDGDTDHLPYYPLGAGPRYCIGARLGMTMMQVQLCYLLHHFQFTAIDPEIDFKIASIVITDSNGIHLKIEKRN